MSVSASAVLSPRSTSNGKSLFYPRSPSSFEDAGLNTAIVEGLVLKFLVNSGMASGRRIAAELGLAVSTVSRVPASAQEPAIPLLRRFFIGK